MGQLLGFVKTMVIGGLLFLFPLVFVTFVIAKAFALMLQLTRPIVERLVRIPTIANVAVIDIVAIVALLAVCLVWRACSRIWGRARRPCCRRRRADILIYSVGATMRVRDLRDLSY